MTALPWSKGEVQMFTKQFWGGFVIATFIAIGLVAWMFSTTETDIRFPSKTVYVSKDYVSFAGSIVGENRATQNGTVTGECYRELGVCRLYSINQIGHRQTGQIYSDTIQIREWNDKVLRADTQGTNPNQCNYFEIRIYLATEDISYTRIPQKKDGNCADYESKVFNWKIDDSYSWQRLNESIEK